MSKPRILAIAILSLVIVSIFSLSMQLFKSVSAFDLSSSHVEIGKDYLVRGSYDRAIREFSNALKQKPGDAVALVDRGTAYNQLENYPRAIADFNQALKLNPNNALALNNRGVSYFRQGKLNLALSDLDRATKLNPDDPYARLNYAGAALASFQGDKAAQKLQDYLNRTKWTGKFTGHEAVLAILGLRQSKNEAGASKLLKTSMEKLSRLDWPYDVLKYLNGKVSPDELLESVKNSDYDTTQAHCFLALDLLRQNKPKLAKNHIDWVVKYGTKNSVEFWIANNLSISTPRPKPTK